jgi:hypothetical protein
MKKVMHGRWRRKRVNGWRAPRVGIDRPEACHTKSLRVCSPALLLAVFSTAAIVGTLQNFFSRHGRRVSRSRPPVSVLDYWKPPMTARSFRALLCSRRCGEPHWSQTGARRRVHMCMTSHSIERSKFNDGTLSKHRFPIYTNVHSLCRPINYTLTGYAVTSGGGT